MRDAHDIRLWARTRLAGALGVNADAVGLETPIADLGLSSAELLELVGELEGWLGRALPETVLWEAPTINALAALLTLEPQRPADDAPRHSGPRPAGGPVAIIGWDCRLPGADSPEELWQLLSDGHCTVGTAPIGRRGSLGAAEGGYIKQVDLFDAGLFGINPREATRMDPQQRLVLEVAWGALERAAIPPASLRGTATGVFVGISTNDYAQLLVDAALPVDLYAATGNSHSVAANRLSYVLDLRGPSMAVDTACSSSLVALHLAVQSLRSEESDVALVGGVNLILSSRIAVALAQAGALSPTGRCRPFSADADGYVRGEGCVIVVMKRLVDALRDGDPIVGVVHGTAVCQDGRTNGLTAPNVVAQEQVIRAALRDAGVDAADIGYVEAHGTGTPLGDPIEIDALRRVFDDAARSDVCGVGSIKGNVGHLEAAAGVAGLAKLLLSLKHRRIPASLHSERLNPRLAEDGSQVQVTSTDRPWPGSGRPVGSVSSFGFGGTIAHAIVGAPPEAHTDSEDDRPQPHLLALSARTDTLLVGLADRLRTYPDLAATPVGAICETLATGRGPAEVRSFALVDSVGEFIRALDALKPNAADADVGVAFVFGGHGSQYPGMGRHFYQTQAVFRATIDQCDRAVAPYLKRPLVEILFSSLSSLDAGELGRGAAAQSQPALFAVQLGLAQLVRSWGVEPKVVVGHSVGEYAAACVAGALSVEEAVRLVAARGRLMDTLAADATMLHVGADIAAVDRARARFDIHVASVNGPSSTVVVGPAAEIEAFAAVLRGDDVESRLIAAPPSHSPWVEPILKAFAAEASSTVSSEPRIVYVSGMTGAPLDRLTPLDGSYWTSHLRRPVLFEAALQATLGEGCDVLLELDPHPVVRAAAILPSDATRWLTLLRRGGDDQSTLLEAAGRLWVAGAPVDWTALLVGATRRRRVAALPASPLDRQRYWADPSAAATFSHTAVPRPDGDLGGDPAPAFGLSWHDHRPSGRTARQRDWTVVGAGTLPAAIRAALRRSVDEPAASAATGTIYLAPQAETSARSIASACDELRRVVIESSEAGRGTVVVTCGAVRVSAGDGPRDPAQAAIRAFARSLALERAGAVLGLIDADPTAPKRRQIGDIAEALSAVGDEHDLCTRAGHLLVPRLLRQNLPEGRITCRGDATYLIVGGLGTLGLRTARHLVHLGARRLVLTSRRGLPSRSSWTRVEPAGRARVDAIEQLEAEGVAVLPAALDLTDEGATERLLTKLRDTLPPLRGVVNAAGTAAPTAMGELDANTIAQWLNVKTDGALALHRATASMDLDFYVVYSSAAAVWGSALLSPYAAGNAFLAALIDERRSAGLPGTAIHWGLWEGGLAGNESVVAAFRRIGLRPLVDDSAFVSLDRAMANEVEDATVVEADWDRLVTIYEAADSSRKLLHELSKRPASESPDGGPGRRPTPDPVGLLTSLVAEALGTRPTAVRPDLALIDEGLDSVCAVDLKTAIEREFGVEVALSELLGDDSVTSLAMRIAGSWTRAPETVTDAPAATPEASTRVLSLGEERLWFLDQLEPGLAVYNIPAAVRVTGELNVEALQHAFRDVVARHEPLRTRYISERGIPKAEVVPAALDFEEFDLSSLLDADVRALDLVAAEAARPFDLGRGNLLRVRLVRVSGIEHLLSVTLHHIVSDGWSVGVLLRELALSYAARVRGDAPDLRPLGRKYGDWAKFERDHANGPDGERLTGYWTRTLADAPAVDLPFDRPRPARRSHAGALIRFDVDPVTARALRAVCREAHVTPFAGLLTLVGVVLSRWTGEPEICVGSPVANRTWPEGRHLIGLFVNTVVLRLGMTSTLSFAEALTRTGGVVRDALDHEALPFGQVVQALSPSRALNQNPLFEVLFTFQNAPVSELELPGLEITPANGGPFTFANLEVPIHTAKFDLSVTFEDEPSGGFAGVVEYSTETFEAASIDRLVGYIHSLVRHAAFAPHTAIGDLPILSDDAQAEVLRLGTGMRRSIPSDLTVPSQFLSQVKADPQAPAIVDDGVAMSYQDVEQKSRLVASALIATGVRPGDLVGICIDRGMYAPVAILGVLRAGAAYVPLDAAYPHERLRHMIEDAAIDWVVTRPAQTAVLNGLRGRRIVIDDLDMNTAVGAEALPPLEASDLAYVLYTSGSTGAPKGVMVEHGSLINAYCAWEERYALRPGLRHLQVAGLSFDVATGDIVRALGSGGTIIHCPNQVAVDPAAFVELANRHEVSIVEVVPAVARVVVAHMQRTGERIPSLERFIVGSDLWTPADHLALAQVFGPSTECLNSFGATEATIDTTCFAGSVGPTDAAVPVGQPLANMEVRILDGSRALSPLGAVGDLWIGGVGVARGYLRRPELTDAQFVPDPFGDDGNRRLYRTGDRARLRPDGNLVLAGRLDSQVKIRGIRIELGEVEAALLRSPSISAAAAAMTGGPQDPVIEAFIVPAPGCDPTSDELSRAVRQVLPEQVCPRRYVMLPALPLLPNGKVNRQALSSSGGQTPRRESMGRPPKTDAERRMAEIWQELLGVAAVGCDDNFFDLGGHSLLAVQVGALAEQRHGITVPVRLMFETDTLGDLARHLPSHQVTPKTGMPIPVAARIDRRVTFVDGAVGRVEKAKPDDSDVDRRHREGHGVRSADDRPTWRPEDWSST